MEPHQERVIVEKRELDAKLDKLSEFIDSGKVDVLADKEEAARLRYQRCLMRAYSSVLFQRINSFPPDKESPPKEQ